MRRRGLCAWLACQAWLFAVVASAQYYTIKLDTQYPERELFIDRMFSANTPYLRAYFYQDGVPLSLGANWVSFKFYYGLHRYTTSGLYEVTGNWVATNRVDFGPTTNCFVETYDKYYWSIVGVTAEGYTKTFGIGRLSLEYDPAAGEPTVLSAKTTINWSLYSYVGTPPWMGDTQYFLGTLVGWAVTNRFPYTNCPENVWTGNAVWLSVPGIGTTQQVDHAAIAGLSGTQAVHSAQISSISNTVYGTVALWRNGALVTNTGTGWTALATACSNALDGDTVAVWPGSFFVPTNQYLDLTNAINLVSLGGPYSTIVTGYWEGQQAIFARPPAGKRLVVDGFSFCARSPSLWIREGTAGGGTVTVRRCIFNATEGTYDSIRGWSGNVRAEFEGCVFDEGNTVGFSLSDGSGTMTVRVSGCDIRMSQMPASEFAFLFGDGRFGALQFTNGLVGADGVTGLQVVAGGILIGKTNPVGMALGDGFQGMPLQVFGPDQNVLPAVVGDVQAGYLGWAVVDCVTTTTWAWVNLGDVFYLMRWQNGLVGLSEVYPITVSAGGGVEFLNSVTCDTLRANTRMSAESMVVGSTNILTNVVVSGTASDSGAAHIASCKYVEEAIAARAADDQGLSNVLFYGVNAASQNATNFALVSAVTSRSVYVEGTNVNASTGTFSVVLTTGLRRGPTTNAIVMEADGGVVMPEDLTITNWMRLSYTGGTNWQRGVQFGGSADAPYLYRSATYDLMVRMLSEDRWRLTQVSMGAFTNYGGMLMNMWGGPTVPVLTALGATNTGFSISNSTIWIIADGTNLGTLTSAGMWNLAGQHLTNMGLVDSTGGVRVAGVGVCLTNREIAEGWAITLNRGDLGGSVTIAVDAATLDGRYLTSSNITYESLAIGEQASTQAEMVVTGDFSVAGFWTLTNCQWSSSSSNIVVSFGETNAWIVPSNALAIVTGAVYLVRFDKQTTNSGEAITVRLGGITRVSGAGASQAITNIIGAVSTESLSIHVTATNNSVKIDNVSVRRLTNGNFWAVAGYLEKLTVINVYASTVTALRVEATNVVGSTGTFSVVLVNATNIGATVAVVSNTAATATNAAAGLSDTQAVHTAQITSNQTAITGLATTNGTQDTALTGLATTNATQDSAITGLATTNGTQDTAITGLSNTQALHTASVTGINTTNAAQGTAITGLSTTNAGQDTAITGLSGTQAVHTAQIASNLLYWSALTVQDPTNGLFYWQPPPVATNMIVREVFAQAHGCTGTVYVLVKAMTAEVNAPLAGIEKDLHADANGVSDEAISGASVVTNGNTWGFVVSNLSAFAWTNELNVFVRWSL